MSYCRWSDESNVYVFENVDGYFECCGCWLNSVEEDDVFADSFTTPVRKEMLTHLEAHRKAGHKVPDYAIAALQDEMDRGLLDLKGETQ